MIAKMSCSKSRLRFALGAAVVAFSAAAADGSFFVGWPVDAKPSSVSRRIAEQFLSTVPDYYKPDKGYRLLIIIVL